MKILQASAECYGLAKTGGLADMVSSLTSSLSGLGHDLRICLPAYKGTLEQLSNLVRRGRFRIHNYDFELIEGYLSSSEQTVFLLNCPALYSRDGDPYRDVNNEEFADNGMRFGCFNLAVDHLIACGFGNWRPEIVQLHDWHLGLTAALLKQRKLPVKTVFTIHNFSFHGLFDRDLFDRLDLPNHWWHPEELEFYGRFSFMKAGLSYADTVTVVSPRYAEEIQTAEFGCGLEGLVRKQAKRVQGIVNGIDQDEWNPATDRHLTCTYNKRSVTSGKKANKTALQQLLGLPVKDVPLAIFIGRLAEQKGPDLILDARPLMEQHPLQLVVLGRGEHHLEEAFRTWAAEAPEQVACVIDVNEEMAHLLTAAADLQLMPSRFEPCGLSQMYAQRYGTLPIAHRTGGLADTIIDASAHGLSLANGTGVLFDQLTADALMQAVTRALDLLQEKNTLKKLRQSAMSQNFSWALSAQAYVDLYESLLHHGASRSPSFTLATALVG